MNHIQRFHRHLLLLILSLLLVACGGVNVADSEAAATDTLGEPVDDTTSTGAEAAEVETAPVVETDDADTTGGDEDEPAAATTLHENEDLGIAFLHRVDWGVRDDDGMIMVASDEALLDSDTLDDGVGVIITAEESMGVAPGDVLDVFVAQFDGMLDNQELVSEPATLSIKGQEAAQATYRGGLDGIPVLAQYTLIAGDNRLAVIMSMSPEEIAEQFSQALKELIESVEVRPVEAPVPESDGQTGAETAAAENAEMNTTDSDEGEATGSNGKTPDEGSADESAAAVSTQYDTSFPVPDGASGFIGAGGDTDIIYQTSMTLEEVAGYYRESLTARGLTERTITSIVNDQVVNLVFDGADNGQAVVVQAIPLGELTNVTVRFEDA